MLHFTYFVADEPGLLFEKKKKTLRLQYYHFHDWKLLVTTVQYCKYSLSGLRYYLL